MAGYDGGYLAARSVPDEWLPTAAPASTWTGPSIAASERLLLDEGLAGTFIVGDFVAE